MGEDVVRTGVDDLMTFLEGKEKVPLLDVASALSVKPETLQSWVDFLVEEGIVGIEYKFTKPFIYLNRGVKESTKVIKEGELSWSTYREAFLAKARGKRIPEEKAAALWRNHVLVELERKRQFFFDEARKRVLADPDALWNEYRAGVLRIT